MRRRAADEDDDLLGLLAPLQLVDRGVEPFLDRLLPIAAAVGADVRQEVLQLVGAEAEIGPFDDVVVALVAVDDDADAARRHHALDRGDQLRQLRLHVVDDELHAVGRVDDQGDVEADLAQAADVVAEAAAEAADRRPSRTTGSSTRCPASGRRPSFGPTPPMCGISRRAHVLNDRTARRGALRRGLLHLQARRRDPGATARRRGSPRRRSCRRRP